MSQVRARFRSFLRDEGGQAFPLIAVALVALLAGTGLVIDVGRLMTVQRDLQATTDAAALAGAQLIPASATNNPPASSDPVAEADSYSAMSGDSNAQTGLNGVAMAPGYPKLVCLTTLQNAGQACVTVNVGSGAGTQANAIQVQQQASLPLFFGGFLGMHTTTVSATATAAARGGSPRPSNVVVIVDTTLSMNATDGNCGSLTQEQCALNGVQVLLENLNPCGTWQTDCGPAANGQVSNSFNRVSLFTFPAVSVQTASIDTNCTTAFPPANSQNGYYYISPYGTFDMLPTSPYYGVPSASPYNFPIPNKSYLGLNGNPTDPTYQITPFVSDYRTSDSSTTLNVNSALVRAVGGKPNCPGIAPPNYEADYETYYAGVLYAAQSALVAEQAQFPGSENVIIILSDGDSNALQNGGEVSHNAGLDSYTANYPNMTATPPAGENYYKASAGGAYPSWQQECAQAVNAAKAATQAGTLVYAVGYGSEPTGCQTDTSPSISPCNTMAGMASAPQYFYSDYQQSGSGSTCIASQKVTSLSAIFAAIAADLTEPRLVPNNTT